MTHYSLFTTALGDCGIAWRDNSVVATQLPEATPATTAERLTKRSGATKGQPTGVIAQAIELIISLLEGHKADLSVIHCDLSTVDTFSMQVYELTRAIPVGETLTYGAIAAQLGNKRLAQQVGRTLGRNPCPIVVPCHRVVGANDKLTGFSAHGGVATKLKMLPIEGARMGSTPDLFDGLLPNPAE